jgi:protein SCO1/2
MVEVANPLAKIRCRALRQNRALPRDVVLVQEDGRPLAFGDLLQESPLFLTFAYLRTPGLRSLHLASLAAALRSFPGTAGRDYEVVVVSIDPADAPWEMRAPLRQASWPIRHAFTRGSAGWRFLAGAPYQVSRLAAAADCPVSFDHASGQYRHSSQVLRVGPAGRVCRSYSGVGLAARALVATL